MFYRGTNFIKWKIKFNEKFYRAIIPYAIWKLKKVKFKDLNELADFSFNWLNGIIKPMQIREEILELLKLLSERKPRVVLEIGTANGGTLFLWTRIATPDAIIISIGLEGDILLGKFHYISHLQ